MQALSGLDPIVEQELKTFQVPGVAVAVVVGDEVVLAKGYGLRDVDKKLPMSAETQMPIASVTKQFTVAGDESQQFFCRAEAPQRLLGRRFRELSGEKLPRQ